MSWRVPSACSSVPALQWALFQVKTRMTTDRFCKMLRLRCYNFSASWKSYAMHVFNLLPDILVNAWSTHGYIFNHICARPRSFKAGETR